MGFHADGVDAGVGATPAGHLVQRVEDVGILVMDSLRAAVLPCHAKPLRKSIDPNDAFGPEHVRALDRELPERPAPPDRDHVAGMDVAVLGRHVPGREDVRQKQQWLVGVVLRDLDGAHVVAGNRVMPARGLVHGAARGRVFLAVLAHRHPASLPLEAGLQSECPRPTHAVRADCSADASGRAIHCAIARPS
jgi:hypothetical protein